MREKFIRFMQGRNGVDQFSRFTMGVALVAIVLTLFTGTRNGLGAFLDILEWQLLSIRITGFFPRIFPSAMQRIRNIFLFPPSIDPGFRKRSA